MKKLNLQLLVMIVLMNSSFIVQGMLLSKRAEPERSIHIITQKKAAAKAKQEKEAAEARIRIEEAKVKAEAKERERIEDKSKQKEREGLDAFLTTTTIGEIKKSNQELDNYLFILGLNVQSTPLAIRFRYDLLMKKKLDDNERVKVENAYASLLNMLSVTTFYATSLNKLKGMSLDEVKAIRKEESKLITPTQPLHKKRKKELIEKPILTEIEEYQKMLDDNFSDCFSVEQPSFLSFKKYFALDKNATPEDVTIQYNAFIQRNNPEVLKKRIELGELSQKGYEQKQLLIKKFEAIYTRYAVINKIGRFSKKNEMLQNSLDKHFSDCFSEKPTFFSFKTFFKLNNNATPDEVTAKYNRFIKANNPEALNMLSEQGRQEQELLIKKFKAIYTRYEAVNKIGRFAPKPKLEIGL